MWKPRDVDRLQLKLKRRTGNLQRSRRMAAAVAVVVAKEVVAAFANMAQMKKWMQGKW